MIGDEFDFSRYSRIADDWGVPSSKVDALIDDYRNILNSVPSDTPEIDDWIRDRRSAEEFIRDLIDAWITEDIAFLWLEQKFKEIDPGARVMNNGSDRDRKIQFGQKPPKVTTISDFSVELSSGKKFPLEFMFSNKVRESYDIKEGKVRRGQNEGTVFFFLVKPNRQYFVFTTPEVLARGNLVMNPYYHKPCYNLVKGSINLRSMGEPLRISDFV